MIHAVRLTGWFLAGLGATVHPVTGGVGLLGALIRRPPRPLGPLAMPLALVGTMALLSGVLPPSTPGTTWPTRGYVALAGVLAWTYVRIDLGGETSFAWGLLLGGLVNAGVGASQAVVGSGSVSGLAFDHNIYAAYQVLGLGAAGWLGSRASSARARVALIVAGLALVAGLIPSGSRSGLIVLALFGVALLPFVAARWRPRVVLLGSLSVAVLVLGLVVADAALSGAPSRNLLVNGGFKDGTYPWRLGPVAARVIVAEPESGAPSAVVRLDSERARWDVPLSYGPRLPVDEGASYMLSFNVRPVAGGAATRSFVRVTDVDAGSSVVGRVARDGWADGDEGRAGGRIMLPAQPVDVWQRVTVPLDAFPSGRARCGRCSPPAATRGRTRSSTPCNWSVETPPPPTSRIGGRVEMWRSGLRFAA